MYDPNSAAVATCQNPCNGAPAPPGARLRKAACSHCSCSSCHCAANSCRTAKVLVAACRTVAYIYICVCVFFLYHTYVKKRENCFPSGKLRLQCNIFQAWCSASELTPRSDRSSLSTLESQVSKVSSISCHNDGSIQRNSKENCWFYTPRFPDARVDQNARILVTNIAAELANDAHGCLSPKNLICQLLMVITIVISPCYDISYDTLFVYY